VCIIPNDKKVLQTLKEDLESCQTHNFDRQGDYVPNFKNGSEVKKSIAMSRDLASRIDEHREVAKSKNGIVPSTNATMIKLIEAGLASERVSAASGEGADDRGGEALSVLGDPQRMLLRAIMRVTGMDARATLNDMVMRLGKEYYEGKEADLASLTDFLAELKTTSDKK